MAIIGQIKIPNDTTSYNLRANAVFYGESTSAANTATKSVIVNEKYGLETDSIVVVNFKNSNSAANISLNVNFLGAKPMMYKGTRISGDFQSGVYAFIYDGSNYNLIGDIATEPMKWRTY